MNLYSSLNQYFEITSPSYNIFWAIFIADFLTFNTSGPDVNQTVKFTLVMPWRISRCRLNQDSLIILPSKGAN